MNTLPPDTAFYCRHASIRPCLAISLALLVAVGLFAGLRPESAIESTLGSGNPLYFAGTPSATIYGGYQTNWGLSSMNQNLSTQTASTAHGAICEVVGFIIQDISVYEPAEGDFDWDGFVNGGESDLSGLTLAENYWEAWYVIKNGGEYDIYDGFGYYSDDTFSWTGNVYEVGRAAFYSWDDLSGHSSPVDWNASSSYSYPGGLLWVDHGNQGSSYGISNGTLKRAVFNQ